MSRGVKLLTCIAVVLSFCMLCIGFATLQDTLGIEGEINLKVANTMQAGDFIQSSFNGAIAGAEENNETITRIVLDNYANQGDLIEAAGLIWEDGEDVSNLQNESIKRFTVGDTIYVLAKDNSIILFHEDSSDIFCGLSQIEEIHLNTVDLSECKKLDRAFMGCESLIWINYNNVLPDLSSVESMEYFFSDCRSMPNFLISGLNLSSCVNAKYMFSGCTSLKSIDLSQVKFSNALQDVSGMFEGCTQMTQVILTGMNTSGVISAASMFRDCHSLYSITGISELDMSSVQLLTDMFAYCTSLSTLDLSGWGSASATNTAGMFGGCENLREIDLYGIVPTQVTDISYMFSNRGSRDGDESVDSMQLSTVYVPLGWNISSVTLDEGVFLGTEEIVGGEGFVFNGTVDKTHAVADKLSARGYLSLSQRDWGELYTIIYHSFDASGADYEYETAQVYENKEVILNTAPAEHSELTFLGWSPYGTWISDEESDFYPNVSSQVGNLDDPQYYPERRVLHQGGGIYTGEQLSVIIGSTYELTRETGEIHLYDLYTEYYILFSAKNLAYNRPGFEIYIQTGESSSSISTGQRFYRHYFWQHALPEVDSSEFYPKFAPYFEITGMTRTHYAHPGLYIRLKPVTISSSDGQYNYHTTVTVDGKSYSASVSNSTATLLIKPSVLNVTISVSRETKDSGSGSGSGSGSDDGTCLAPGTMITLADGSKKAVEDIRKGDVVMAVDHLTGQVVCRDVIIVIKTYSELYHKNTFVFDDGSRLSTINEHGIFDLDINKYVNIDHENYEQYIGHRFLSIDSDGNMGTKILVDVVSVCESGYKYDIVTNGTFDYVAEDTLSVTHVLVDMINTFDFGENLIYDQEKMLMDIERYGLYTYDDEWRGYCDLTVFEQYNGAITKVGIAKGLYTLDYVLGLINGYVLNDDVQIQ